MKKKVVRIFVLLLVVLLWGFFFLFQHIACFDVFDTNEWYLYVIAISFACLQHVLFYVAGNQSPPRGFFTFFGMVYIIVLSYPAVDILRYPTRLPGLFVLGLCLDALSILLVFAWHRCRKTVH